MVEPGFTFSEPYVFTRENIARFAEEAGDRNPLHHDVERANASRFGTIIACGAQMSGVLMSVAASLLAGSRESVGLDFHFRFKKAIPEGTATTLSWTVVSIEPHVGLKGHLVTMDGRIADEAGTVYVTSEAKGVVWP